jgi:hypothetical protein
MKERQPGLILLDVPPGIEEDFDVDILERMGHPVVVCHGPGSEEEVMCPLLTGEGCAMYEDAHGIAFELDLDRDQHRAILQRYRELASRDLPIRVFVTPEQAERYADLLSDFEVWSHEPSVADLDGFAAEVEAADRLAD